MRVIIKRDQSIPDGYTYINCNNYTPEEFIKACSPSIKGCVNQNALDYVQEHPRESYDTEDLYRVRMMPPAIRRSNGRKKAEKNIARPERRMPGPVASGDMTIRQMADHCGVGVGTLDNCVINLGMPHRWGFNAAANRNTKYLRPREVLQFMEKLRKPTEKHMMVMRRLRQDLEEVEA